MSLCEHRGWPGGGKGLSGGQITDIPQKQGQEALAATLTQGTKE